MKIGLIVNPIAGGGKAVNSIPQIQEQLGDITELVITKMRGEAESNARKFSRDGFDMVAVAGGDGTLNEVAQALTGTDTAMIPLPFGNGSDFIKSVGNIAIAELSEAVKAAKTRKIDTVLLELGQDKFHFINIMELGFGALVMKRFNERRRYSGDTSFTRQILREALRLRQFPMQMVSDTFSYSGNLIEGIFANGKYFGRGLLAAPGASIDDGLMEIHLIEGMGKAEFLMKLRKIKNGSYTTEPKVKNYTAKNIEVSTAGVPCEVDGEFMGFTPMKARVEPLSLKILQM